MSSIPHHEAGHCLVAWLYAKPGSVSALLACDASHSGGFTFSDLSGAEAWQRNAVNLAGPLAAAIYADEHGFTLENEPPESHQAEVFAWLRQTLEDAGARMGDDREPLFTPESLVAIEGGARRRSVEARTLRLLRRHWPAVEAIAVALEAHGRIDARQLTSIMRRHGVERQSL